MEHYYAKQASLPHFSGHYRQRGSGFDALATGIGRVVIPFARRVFVPAAKKMGRELLMCAAPELIDVAMRKKSLNSLRNTVTKTARKQLGGGRRRRNTSMTGLRRRWSVAARKRKTTIRKKTRSARNRADFFLKQKTDRLIVTQ